ncbi:MAG: hypothetical protein II615_01780 [Ruminococcus sp.]|nr:hypothetical protein [Ruminococcus sp.]
MNLYQKKARRAWLALVLAAVMTGSPLPAHAATGKTVVLGGQPFGVRFFGDGVMVVQTEEFFSGGRYVCPAEDGAEDGAFPDSSAVTRMRSSCMNRRNR